MDPADQALYPILGGIDFEREFETAAHAMAQLLINASSEDPDGEWVFLTKKKLATEGHKRRPEKREYNPRPSYFSVLSLELRCTEKKCVALPQLSYL